MAKAGMYRDGKAPPKSNKWKALKESDKKGKTLKSLKVEK